jgi:hypothetical protein
MLKLKEKILTDKNGKATAIVLDIQSYRRLWQHLEDLEDALELDKARRAAKRFRTYDVVRADLNKARRLCIIRYA